MSRAGFRGVREKKTRGKECMVTLSEKASMFEQGSVNLMLFGVQGQLRDKPRTGREGRNEVGYY